MISILPLITTMTSVERCRLVTLFIVFTMGFTLRRTDGKFLCSPDDHHQRCQWTFYGWHIYRGCVYHQKIDGPLCLMKTLDGSKGTLLTKMNITSKEFDHCFRFKYLTTGRVSICMYFYSKSSMKINTQSHLFSNFCVPNEQVELSWYFHSIILPKNTILLNAIVETSQSNSNFSLTVTDLFVEDCHQSTTTSMTTSDRKRSTSAFPPSSKIGFNDYWWNIAFSLAVLLVLLSFLILIILYISHRRRQKQINIVRRAAQSNVITPSRHFYEEPISVILAPTIEISEYDHVRDNYI